MPRSHRRDDLAANLIRAGEREVSGTDQDEIDSYFDTENFEFHGPDGRDADYGGLTEYLRSPRAANGPTQRPCFMVAMRSQTRFSRLRSSVGRLSPFPCNTEL